MTKPLAGIRVVEAATLFAAPFAGMLLGDYGAEVVKLEHPLRPDPARGHGPSKDGIGLWFKSLARNKRLVTLDLSRPEGADLFLRLVADADVVLENFRPGTLERWGLGWDELSAANQRLVLARVSGFGQTGPYAARPGFGTLAEAMSGFAMLNGEPDGPPLLPPLALADGVAGLATAFAVLAALRARETTGRGQVVDTSLVEPLLALLGPQLTAYGLLGELAAAHRQPFELERAAERLPDGRRRLGRRVGERDLDRRARRTARGEAELGRGALVRNGCRARRTRGGAGHGCRSLDRGAQPRRGARGLRASRGGGRTGVPRR